MNPIELFENEFKKWIGVKHAKAVCNGSAALNTALLACGIGPGDKVLTTPFTFIATTNSILHCGAQPTFADIDPKTYCLDSREVEKKIEENPDIKALLAGVIYSQAVRGQPTMTLNSCRFSLLKVR